MKYFIIAGEASGDLHASNLMKGLMNSDPQAEFRFIGGDLMKAHDPEGLYHHYSGMNYMGLFAVLANMGRLASILRRTKMEIRKFEPDAVILVDYAGFNLRIAKYASRYGMSVFYYISPKVWAWKKGRIKSLKKYVDRLFCIFPFEKEFFHDHGMDVEYHGNPLMDVIEDFKKKKSSDDFRGQHQLDERPVVALLAGSRKQELKQCLPVMTEVSKAFPTYQFIVAGAPSCDPELYRNDLAGTDVKLIFNATYDLLEHARAGVITSGTATLETALFHLPQVVIYKTGSLTYHIGKLFVNFRFFGLVNLIMGDELVKELLQKDLVRRVNAELKELLDNEEYRQRILSGYKEISRLIGQAGASQRTANRMIELLSEGSI